MDGTVLYPMNQLQMIKPDIFESKASKYIGREFLREDVIPILNCKWNDVIHLSAVSPQKIEGIYNSILGRPTSPQRFFQIDSSALLPSDTIIYWYKEAERKNKFKEGNFEAFGIDKLKDCDIIPPETVAYYKEMFSQNKRPLMFYRIPHILFKGTIETKNTSIIEV